MRELSNIVILTGAGISAESGLATFRGSDGLWEGHRVEDVATPEAFRRDPALVQAFYDARRARLAGVEPNAAHIALARLDAEWPGELLIVTQNVDDLHERAGARRLIHMHGELKSAWCLACDARTAWELELSTGPACPSCGERGSLRPDIVWFGEMPYAMDLIDEALRKAQTARYTGAHELEINLEPSLGSIWFDETRTGPATELVPEWVEEVLGGS
ncbi:MAG: NAD-dependent deacylase [Alphaproteobacteria bacterium]|nr:MAG: NAD-dependent deacylase [Alphaproteobacteria bacterium]